MAKSNKPIKSHAVREYLKANPKAKNQAVVDALAKKGIVLTASYVSNIKTAHNTRQRAVRKVVAKGGVGIPELKAALALLKLTKTIPAATRALAVAKEIREVV
jgi:hypothetical protein